MELEFPIHHVVVVGFHHKKGCQIEYAYPPFGFDIEKTAWKHLPTLAMPDGAHKYSSDTVYFHLPSITKPGETVFGVACYRQIDAEKVKNKAEDVTRSSVQKSVCVLSKYPLYGHIQVKMSLITAAYFREGDFAQVSILEEAYHNLNTCLSPDLLTTPEAFVGLSPRDLIFTFRHEVLLLLKLLLLEKRILFRGPSVGPLCSALLTLISLIPLTVEYGLQESACFTPRGRLMSIVPQFSKEKNEQGGVDGDEEKVDLEKPVAEPTKKTKDLINTCLIQGSVATRNHEDDGVDHQAVEAITLSREPSIKSEGSEKGGAEDVPDFITAVQLTPADAGLPLTLFSKGYLCHPYLSLHYMDLLSDSGVRGFIVGATNVLFKQKKDLVDVVVEMAEGSTSASVEIYDSILRKVISLSTEDLRFADNLVRNVTQGAIGGSGSGLDSPESPGFGFMDGVGWEGGDEWVRAQFKYYLMCLMRTSLTEEGNRLRDCFSSAFLMAWQNTQHWKNWNEYVNSEERETPGIYLLSPGHPCSGQMGVSDMKLKLSHSIQKSEAGRRVNKAVSSTGKAVGGALSSAKGALSSWWSTMTTAPTATTTMAGSSGSAEETQTTQSEHLPDNDTRKLDKASKPSSSSSSASDDKDKPNTDDGDKRQSNTTWFTA